MLIKEPRSLTPLTKDQKPRALLRNVRGKAATISRVFSKTKLP